MKNKIVFSVLFSVNVVYSEYQYCPVSNKDSGYIHNGQLVPKCTENDSPEIWSGSWEDLQAVAKRVKEKFSFETTKHKSRDITSLKPASKQEMEKHISNGNYQEWNEYIFDSYHESPNVVDALKTEIRKIIPVGMFPILDVPILLNDVMKVIGGKVVKYTTHRGDEVVYSKADGRIILDEQLGTRNFGDNYDYLGSELFTKFTKQSVNEIIMNNVQLSSLQPLSPLLSKKLNRVIQLVMEFPTHKERDMDPHENDNQYKYAGILFESGSDGRFYIVDGQTGKRMTKKQVEDFPTTFSDMWKDKGLVCVESDAIDIVPPKENRQSAQNASSEVGVVGRKDNVAKTDVDEAKAMAMGDKCDVIKAIEQLISCMKERIAAVDSVSRRLPKRSMSDIRGILSDGDAISAESARYAERVEKCIETLNVSFLKMEKEFSNDSTVQIDAIREKRYNSIKPHIIELFEILRDSPDKIRHRVENVIPIQLARYLVNCDNRIRKKYYLLPSFGFEL